MPNIRANRLKLGNLNAIFRREQGKYKLESCNVDGEKRVHWYPANEQAIANEWFKKTPKRRVYLEKPNREKKQKTDRLLSYKQKI